MALARPSGPRPLRLHGNYPDIGNPRLDWLTLTRRMAGGDSVPGVQQDRSMNH